MSFSKNTDKDKEIQEQIVKFYKELEPILNKALMKAKEDGQILVDPYKFTFSTIYG